MKKVFLSLAAIALIASTYSCKETVEVRVDDTAEIIHTDTENAFDRAGDAIEDAADATGEALEDAGDAIEDAADDVKVEVEDATDGN